MIRIREMERGDLVRVNELLCSLAEFTSGDENLEEETVKRTFSSLQAQPDLYCNFVAENEGRVAGVLTMIVYRSLFHSGGTALINELVVDQDLRSRGIGRALVDRAVREAAEAGMDEIEVGTEVQNNAALRFYRGCGFTKEYRLLGRDI
jgi:ribosomal protein S18 acetylase RimI-like enzyme